MCGTVGLYEIKFKLNDEELKDILAKKEEILGKSRLQSFRIEINDLMG